MMSHKPLDNDEAFSASRFMDRLASPLEGLANLTFLALEEAQHPEKVRFYMHMAEEQMHVIRQIALETQTGLI
jgi:hypothetical protein